MADTERNKQTVARVFDAFRAGDVDAFDDPIAEGYVQHNPQADNGLQAVKAFFAPVGPVDVEVYRVIAEGDLVVAHSHYKTWNLAGVDIWRFDDEGKMIEHWDVLQQVPKTTASGNDMSPSSRSSGARELGRAAARLGQPTKTTATSRPL